MFFFRKSQPEAFSDMTQRSLSSNSMTARLPMGSLFRNHWYSIGQHFPLHNLMATTFFLSASPWKPIPHLSTSQQQLPSPAKVSPSLKYFPSANLNSLSNGTSLYATTLPLPFSQSGSCPSSSKQRLCLACLLTTLPYIIAFLSHSSLANSSNNSLPPCPVWLSRQSTPLLTTNTQASSPSSLPMQSLRLTSSHLQPSLSKISIAAVKSCLLQPCSDILPIICMPTWFSAWSPKVTVNELISLSTILLLYQTKEYHSIFLYHQKYPNQSNIASNDASQEKVEKFQTSLIQLDL